jgi:CP family cyanate transporter-like MFS transporter
VLVAALGIRPQLVLLGPLVPWLATEFGTDHTTLGLIATSALLATAAGATLTGRIVRRSGTADTVTLALATLVVAIVVRALAPSIPWLIAGSVLAGLAIGVSSSALPAWMASVKLPAALGSTTYTIGMIGGSILAGLLAAPLAQALGGWRGAVAILGTLTVLSFGAWLARPRPAVGPGKVAARATAERGSAGHAAVLIALAFGLQAAVYQGIAQWAPDLLGEEGWPAASAGAVVGLVNLIALVANVVAFANARRLGGARRQAAVAALLIVAGTTLIAVARPIVPGIVVTSLGLGLIFPASFAVVLEIARDPAEASAIAGRMNALGFVIAAIAPLGLGVTRDLTGSYQLPMLELVALAGMLVVTTTALLRQPDEAPRRRDGSGDLRPDASSAAAGAGDR